MAGEFFSTVYGFISARLARSTLGDLCVPDCGVQTGPFGSQLHASDYVNEGTPIITVEHLGDNRIIHTNVPRVTDEDKKRLARYSLITGDIVFSRVGSVDRRAIVQPDEDGWLFSGRCLRVRPDRNKIDPGYLSWFFGLPGFQEHIRQIAVGATMPSLNTRILEDVHLLP
jgi:type I restriction enzyme S subunit